MREIKFRGLTKYNKWVFGTPVYYESGEASIFGKFPRYGVEATNISIRDEVIPETISQYTGLKDKNGKEIYEGDIIKNDKGSTSVLDWDNRTCQFKPRSFYDRESWYWQQNEVIGNIHLNPELL